MTKFYYILFRGSFLPLSPANTVNCCTAAQSPSLSRQSCSVALRGTFSQFLFLAVPLHLCPCTVLTFRVLAVFPLTA